MVTIKDLARIAKVSHTTVSRALNDSPLIKQVTKDKIKEIAKKYNYAPNVNARSLVLDKSYNIGLFFSTIHNGTSSSFFFEVVTGVNSVIKDVYSLSVKGIDAYSDFDLINKKRYDGILLMSQSHDDNVFIEHILEREIPLVLMNRKAEEYRVTTLLSNDTVGAFSATEYLIKNGHREIGLVEGKEGFQSAKDRKAGFLEALEKHKIQYNKNFSVSGDYAIQGGYLAMKKILAHKTRPTAVFCSNDDMAVGATKAISELGLHIPDDISIIGFDDNGFSSYLSPALTTVKRPIVKICQEGTTKLMNMIAGKESTETKPIYFSTQLVIRDSVKKL